ncbi:hypothetical protein AMECASPLE_026298 [Ameca splendens]|uniref:Uncharacterized protein n=1 Tax=Ameca splendens TaxID=208324 RepID=A0ABV0ZEQ5_9TELE
MQTLNPVPDDVPSFIYLFLFFRKPNLRLFLPVAAQRTLILRSNGAICHFDILVASLFYVSMCCAAPPFSKPGFCGANKKTAAVLNFQSKSDQSRYDFFVSNLLNIG